MAESASNVALIGPMMSGKDSLAAFLVEFYSNCRRLAFADALKREAAAMLNVCHPVAVPGQPAGSRWTVERIEEHKDMLRPLLQWLGTEYRRASDPDYWVRRLADRLDRLSPGTPCVVTDARFRNELAMLRERGFVIVALEMPLDEIRTRLAARGLSAAQIEARLSHPSENEWRSVAPNFTLQSRVGNLPALARELVRVLKWNTGFFEGGDIGRFFAELHPAIYGRGSGCRT